jgi:membrane protein YdbS with pleckstrin-like domain
MYCDKCGADNSDTAKFCRKCGKSIEEIEEETRVKQRTVQEASAWVPPDQLDAPANVPPDFVVSASAHPAGGDRDMDDEREVLSIRPTLMFIKLGYALAAIGAIILVAFTSAYFFQFVSVTISVMGGLMLFLVPAYYHLRQKLIKYRLTETKLEIDTGLIARSTRNIPLQRIQDVTINLSAVQRLLGYGNIEIDNASEEGGKVVLKNVDSPRHFADLLLKQMGLLER